MQQLHKWTTFLRCAEHFSKSRWLSTHILLYLKANAHFNFKNTKSSMLKFLILKLSYARVSQDLFISLSLFQFVYSSPLSCFKRCSPLHDWSHDPWTNSEIQQEHKMGLAYYSQRGAHLIRNKTPSWLSLCCKQKETLTCWSHPNLELKRNTFSSSSNWLSQHSDAQWPTELKTMSNNWVAHSHP
jgi:hypothetical protein